MSKSIQLALLGKKAVKNLLKSTVSNNLNSTLPINSVLSQQKRFDPKLQNILINLK